MLSRLLRDKRGVSSVEYALLLFGILLVAAAGYRVLGDKGSKAAKMTTAVLMGGEAKVSPGAGYNGSGSSSASGPVCDGRGCSGGPGQNCFVAGTPVWTPRGERPIEEIAAGDMVLSRDEDTGEVREQRVVRTFVRTATALVRIEITDLDGRKETVTATPEHRFWTIDRGWVNANELTSSEPLLDVTGNVVRVVSRAGAPAEATVYNFEVEATHTYFAGHLGAWVHNTCNGPIWDAANGSGVPAVSGSSIQVGINHGTLPPTGVGTWQVTGPPYAIIPVAKPPSLWPWQSPPPGQFNGQYIGLENYPGAIGLPGRPGPQTRPPGLNPNTVFSNETTDPNSDVVFTDPLSGCTVIVTPTNPPHLHHVQGSSLGDDPQTYGTNLDNYLHANGIDPNAHPPPIIVRPGQYGWVTGDPAAAVHGGFVFGQKNGDRRDWWLVRYGADGKEQVIQLGQTPL